MSVLKPGPQRGSRLKVWSKGWLRQLSEEDFQLVLALVKGLLLRRRNEDLTTGEKQKVRLLGEEKHRREQLKR
jgi:hypothetical protein